MSAGLRVWTAVAAAMAVVFSAVAAQAQQDPVPPPPQFPSVDPNGIDVTTRKLTLSRVQASVGEPGGEGLSRIFLGAGPRDNLTGTIHRETFDGPLLVSVGGRSIKFNVIAGGAYENPASPDTLTFDAATQKYTFIAADGTVGIFDRNLRHEHGPVAASEGYLTTLTRPNGEVLTYHYTAWASSCSTGTPVLQCVRLQAVTSTLGYMIKYKYAGTVDQPGSTVLERVTAVNLAHEYCAPLAETCTFTNTWPHKIMSGDMQGTGTVVETDALGRQTTYTFVDNAITQIQQPGGVTTTYSVGPDGGVHQVSDGATTWLYMDGTDDVPGTVLLQVVGGSGNSTSHRAYRMQDGHVVGIVEGGKWAAYELNYPGPRIRKVTEARGNYTEYSYDARGNVTTVKKYPIPGSSAAPFEVTIAYPASCTPTTRTTCNKPQYVLEGSTNGAGGARTDFEYEAHGAVKSVTRPPGANGVRPKTSFSYQQKQAYYHQGSGLAAGPPVWRLTSVSTCITQSPCGGTADETKTNYAYGTAGTANNLRVSSITERAGDDSVLAKTSITYNIYGDIRTIDDPLENLPNGGTDIVRYRYNFEREPLGRVAPDPDGTGPRVPVATRYNLRLDGRLQSADIGTVADQGDSAWAAFNLIERETHDYDAAGRLAATTQTGSGSTHSLVQYSYDAAGRLECTAVRMNPAAFGAPPASACTLGTQGSDGPDRITKNAYSVYDQVVRVTEALGTGAQRDALNTHYSPSGKTDWVADGKGNLTFYEYDDFDRLRRTRYPDPTNIGTASATDYEEVTYDPATWNVAQHRRRNGQVESFTYDQRRNLLSSSLPSLATYSYDNLDRLRTATAGGETVTDTYDALSRLTSSTVGSSTVSYLHDAAGHRKRLTWPDGVYVTYDLDFTGAVTAIKESGSASLVSFTYDLLGRRQALDRANSIPTTYGYDGASRLTSLSHGGSVSQTLTFGYNPASQIKSRTGSNAQLNFTGLQALDHTYTNNGLNQVTAVGAQAITHDNMGNLQSDTASTYSHDAENRLTGLIGGPSLAYDPAGRLRQISTGGVATRFIYDGPDLIAELNASGGLLHRYVHGPNMDEPLVWYEGPGTGAANRRWLHADHQGSIIAITDSGGAVRNLNSYSEYGVPGANNAGRFQYTGQVRVPEIDLYYYKIRFYSGRYGRFLEPDAAGYADGLNLYAYVGNDPLNAVDPTGLGRDCVGGPDGCAEVDEAVVRGRDPITPVLPPPWNSTVTTLMKAPVVLMASAVKAFATASNPSQCNAAVAAGAAVGAGSATSRAIMALGTSPAATGVSNGSFNGPALGGVAAWAAAPSCHSSTSAGGGGGGSGEKSDAKMEEAYRKQLERDGRQSLLKSRASLINRIREHEAKLAEYQSKGGYTSSVEREIRGWTRQLRAIDKVLGN